MKAERICFVTDCGGGPLRRVGPWQGDANCVEGLAACLGLEIWQGAELSPEFAAEPYDLAMVNGNSTLWWLPSWLAKRGTPAVMLWEGGIENYHQRDAASAVTLREALEDCAAVAAYSPGHAAALCLVHKRGVWLGLPLPETDVRWARATVSDARPWLNAPVAFHRGLPGALLLRKLGVSFVQYCHDHEREAYARWLRGADVEFRAPVPHARFRESLADVAGVLAWDPVQSAGRIVLDCAAVGAPVYASETFAAAEFLPGMSRLPAPPKAGEITEHAANVLTGRVPQTWPPYLAEYMPDAVRDRWAELIAIL